MKNRRWFWSIMEMAGEMPDVVIADSLVPGQSMSLFDSKDISYEITVTDPILMKAIQTLRLSNGYQTTSHFTYPALATTDLGIFQVQTKFNHWQDGTLLLQDPSSTGAISTDGGVICIGCDKHSNNFVGELWYGEFDPGCQKFWGG